MLSIEPDVDICDYDLVEKDTAVFASVASSNWDGIVVRSVKYELRFLPRSGGVLLKPSPERTSIHDFAGLGDDVYVTWVHIWTFQGSSRRMVDGCGGGRVAERADFLRGKSLRNYSPRVFRWSLPWILLS